MIYDYLPTVIPIEAFFISDEIYYLMFAHIRFIQFDLTA